MNLAKPKELKDCKTIVDFAYRERYLYLTESDNFRAKFGKNLGDFWDGNILGFDIVKFDHWLNMPDKSCRDAVVEKFGEEAAKLIERLIHNDS